jgi:uncharacterized protein (TIGR00369 family)
MSSSLPDSHEEQWKQLPEEERIEKFTQFFQHINHYDRHHGFKLIIPSLEDLRAHHWPHYEMMITEHHLSSPGVSHGGALASMMDAVLGLKALIESVRHHCLCATVEFKMNFLAPALLGDHLIGKAEIDFRGHSLIIVSGGLYHKQKNHLLCKGMGTFNVYPMNKKVDLYESFFQSFSQKQQSHKAK